MKSGHGLCARWRGVIRTCRGVGAVTSSAVRCCMSPWLRRPARPPLDTYQPCNSRGGRAVRAGFGLLRSLAPRCLLTLHSLVAAARVMLYSPNGFAPLFGGKVISAVLCCLPGCVRRGLAGWARFFFRRPLAPCCFFSYLCCCVSVLSRGCSCLFLGLCRCRLGRLRFLAVAVRGVRGLCPFGCAIPPFRPCGCGVRSLRLGVGWPWVVFVVRGLGCRILGGGFVWRVGRFGGCSRSWRSALFVFLNFFNIWLWCGLDAAGFFKRKKVTF